MARTAAIRNAVNLALEGRIGAEMPSFGSNTLAPVYLRGGPPERREDDRVCGSSSYSVNSGGRGIAASLAPNDDARRHRRADARRITGPEFTLESGASRLHFSGEQRERQREMF
jgi:hypothetical protein